MDKVQYLQSRLLLQAGIRHGWFMRYGGISDGLFESLNGKKGNGDRDSTVDKNRKRAATALSNSGSVPPLAFITHMFKNSINTVTTPGEYKGYDASITINPELALAQATADCGSVIISDIHGTVVSLVHGSWHTLSTNIIGDVVTQMKKHSSDELVTGIGPMICKNCYEYGPEAETLFDKKYLQKINEKYLVDLKQMIVDQLKESGVSTIDDLDVCTLEDTRFFSHRRDGARSGRFLTLARL